MQFSENRPTRQLVRLPSLRQTDFVRPRLNFANDKIKQLNTDFLSAKDQAARLTITDTIRHEAFAQVPTIPLGLFYIRSAYRADLKNMLGGQAPFFWSVRRA